MRIDRRQEVLCAWINIRRTWHSHTWIPAIPVECTVRHVRSLETRRKSVGHAVVEGSGSRQANKPEKSAEYPSVPRVISEPDLRAEVIPIFLLLKTVAATFGKYQRPGYLQSGVNSRQIIVGPMSVLLVITEYILPAETGGYREPRREFVTILGEKCHRLASAVQIRSHRLVRVLHVSQQEGCKTKPCLTRVSAVGCIRDKVKVERSRPLMAIHLVGAEIPSKRKAMPT